MILLNTEKNDSVPVIAILMGSSSDAETMEQARQICKDFDVSCEMKVLSAHRTPEHTINYAKAAKARGTKIIIAGNCCFSYNLTSHWRPYQIKIPQRNRFVALYCTDACRYPSCDGRY